MNLRFFFHFSTFLLAFNLAMPAQTQSWKQRIYIDCEYHYGFLMPHSDYIAFFVREHIRGLQINLGLKTNGVKKWHSSYNYPALGVGYHFSSLGNDNIYGKMNAMYAYVDRYYLNRSKRFNFGNRLSLGVAYINKKFDLETNSTNMAIGSKFNAYVNYSLEATLRISDGFTWEWGAGITHVSNGSFKQPNKGLNFFTTFSGFTYSFNQVSIEQQVEQDYVPKHQFLVMPLLGNKQISRKMDNRYAVGGVSAEYARQLAGNNWGGAALTFYYDPSLVKEISMDNDTATTTPYNNIRVALNLSYELKMGRISYVFQPGVYLKNSFKKPGTISNRLSVRYQLTDHFTAAFTIKAHWFAVADFFEWGLGYKWNK